MKEDVMGAETAAPERVMTCNWLAEAVRYKHWRGLR